MKTEILGQVASSSHQGSIRALVSHACGAAIVFGHLGYCFAQQPAAGPPGASSAPPPEGVPVGAPASDKAGGDVWVGSSVAPHAPVAVSPPPAAVAPSEASAPAGNATADPTRTGAPQAMPAPSAAPPQPAPPAPPPKTEYPVALFLDLGPLWQTSRGYDLFSSNDLLPRVGLTGELDLVKLERYSTLSLDASWSTESAQDMVLGTLSTELSTVNLAGGVRVRRELLPFLAVHGAIMGGASRVKTTLGSEAPSSKWMPSAQLGLGVSGSLVGDMVLKPGVLVEGGYYLSGSKSLEFGGTTPDDGISRVGTQLGTLERSGPYLRFALFARY